MVRTLSLRSSPQLSLYKVSSITFTYQEELFYENGQLESRETDTDNGEISTLLAQYYENGQLRFREPSSPLTGHVGSAGEQYTGGVETYYENGQLWVKGTMTLGDWDGPYESCYQSGEVSSKRMFTAGLLCSEWIEYGECLTYDPCPPSLEGGPQPPHGRCDQRSLPGSAGAEDTAGLAVRASDFRFALLDQAPTARAAESRSHPSGARGPPRASGIGRSPAPPGADAPRTRRLRLRQELR